MGWITTLDKEMAAARAMLDEEHSFPQDYQFNNNIYTLGRIGTHNIILTYLPDGKMGTTTAAIIAQQMCLTFPNIHIRLMVGIGGAAPSAAHDIRLGDVIVGTPYQGQSRVIQNDFGKRTDSSKIHIMSALNRPPDVLLPAVNSLKVQASPLWRRLNPSDYNYLSHQGTCALPRPTAAPIIHYGLIASGNQVMKHGPTRDRIQAELGILCFEMEAAGLVDIFPCLVIRGISDYADSHKNDRWRGYAAAVASAYAKELLGAVPSTLRIHQQT
ncbi:hypothetical protein ASPZODRAFT_153906 [Penicilliopsis zonata CBS 506.65]|uniref:Nucleoside phosphorylase domain-containing protein n=1 Tax=Penicilliopsis zonata CBS 506.65 TaxID=1073090 RepID=A0A1L9SBJ9_9EURO|nr:hypothetical protein ASPZODRAFT_153906 [Penicilliopsis zonata CBS 506.65]OJJ44499.1 hypothetical protein ASPZODRAFT_153906 [Penicilliopsis zonata CBS 506.65]